MGDVHGDAPALSRLSIRDQTTKIVNKSNSGSLAILSAIRGDLFHVLPDGYIRDDEIQLTTASRALATSCPNLQLQQCIRIAVRELGHVGRGERDAVEKVTTLCIGGIGIVDREHDAVDAEG